MSPLLLDEDQNFEVQKWFAPEVSRVGAPGDPAIRRSPTAAAPRPKAEPVPAPPTLEEIEALQQAAREEGFRQGHAEGLELGLNEGREQGRIQMLEEAQNLAQVLESLTPVVERLDRELEQELVELAVAVARQLIRRELHSDPSQIIAAIRAALPLLPAYSRGIRLFLHPEDAAIVRENLHLSQASESWKLLEDPTITRGGARLESETARLDATVETRMNAIIAELWGGTRRGESRDRMADDGTRPLDEGSN
jgi:flagellar assembly protein FliH